ncbi:histidine phosphatase family protein [Massilia sp. S19_KUP03_FR1]|uniref:histidine phosphatase family protein n=1 Tax=Massilia sp. S19_KUP03_FR1 TaxID=3025503 RepID=UPI002FCD342E
MLVRHGETAWNAERRLQGHLDIALNAEGERQAAAVARALAGTHIDTIVSSDLQRASQTAQAIAASHALPVQVERALRERCYGGFEGLLYSEIEQRFPHEFAQWQAREVDAVLPAGANLGESFRQFYARCTNAIIAVATRCPGQTIVLVAHGGVLECAYRCALGMALETPRTFTIPNASINRFTFQDGKLTLISWGEIEHLQQVAMDELN